MEVGSRAFGSVVVRRTAHARPRSGGEASFARPSPRLRSPTPRRTRCVGEPRPRPHPARVRIAIIGAGLAGLTAARHLAAAGVPALIFEKGRPGAAAVRRRAPNRAPSIKARSASRCGTRLSTRKCRLGVARVSWPRPRVPEGRGGCLCPRRMRSRRTSRATCRCDARLASRRSHVAIVAGGCRSKGPRTKVPSTSCCSRRPRR